MVKKITKNLKFAVCCMLIMSLVAPSYAALSASDGSAFVTKAEFDAALADFNSRLTTFEAGINSKIDSQVTSYLDRNGIWNGKQLNLPIKGVIYSQDLAGYLKISDDVRKDPRKWFPTEYTIVSNIEKSGMIFWVIHFNPDGVCHSGNGESKFFDSSGNTVSTTITNLWGSLNRMLWAYSFTIRERTSADALVSETKNTSFIKCEKNFIFAGTSSSSNYPHKYNLVASMPQVDYTFVNFVSSGNKLTLQSEMSYTQGNWGSSYYTASVVDLTNSNTLGSGKLRIDFDEPIVY